MKLSLLKDLLARNAESNVGFVLPDGKAIDPDFHVTEVGHVVKNFIDCGGTARSRETCVLQVWLASNDKDHRLTAGKLAAILELAKSVVPSDDIDVEVEYEDVSTSQYPIEFVDDHSGALRFKLENRPTDCLAREACGLEPCGEKTGCC
ncbi:MAG TPA: DUF6428 family protein [Opitutaceae bacterium]